MLDQALHQHFGFAAFRGVQREVITRTLAGASSLVILPTGEGKSLCYQLPALLLPGTTLVVSPLIALMEDQVQALRSRGIAATCLHSQLVREERERRLQGLVRGQWKLCYVTPERFRVPGFRAELAKVAISLLAIDEAHCLSQWGHDFRPDYGQLGEVRRGLGDPPTLALTATATPQVQADILRVLRLQDARTFHTGIERKNLYLEVHAVHSREDKLARLHEILAATGGPGIVYFALIQELLRVEELLQRQGLHPLVYHGDLSASERKEQQARFLASADTLILATNAFGLGVDKPDIRCIVHWQIPRTLEAYYQEIGRAGRDGKGALCDLLYLEEDIAIQRDFCEWANPGRELLRGVVQQLASAGERLQTLDLETLKALFLVKQRRDGRVDTCLRLLRTAGCCSGELGRDFAWLRTPSEEELAAWTPEGKRERDLTGLLAMVRYAQATGCRKQVVHAYFGGATPPNCGACSFCVPEAEWLTQHLPEAARRAIVAPAAPADGEVRRGDWIEVDGLGLCTVLRVHREARRTRIEVQTHGSLETVVFTADQRRWRRVR